MNEEFKSRLIDAVNRDGLQGFAERLLCPEFDNNLRNGVTMSKQQKRALLYRQKTGNSMYSHLLGTVDGVRTTELAVENLLRYLRKHPHLKERVKELL